MCGIFGVIAQPSSRLEASELKKLVKKLFLEAESLGKDSRV